MTATLELRNGEARLVATVVGDGRPVVLLHAGRERRHVWRPVAEGLAVAGCRSIALDQRGHGDSDVVGADRLDTFVADLQVLLTTLDEPAVVVGASLGGFVALLAAAATTPPVAAVALVDVIPDPDPIGVRLFLGEQANAPLVHEILGRADELRRAASSLRLPVLLVRGGDSPVLADADVDRFLGLVPHAEVATVEGAGHLVARDQPKGLLAVLAPFVGHP